MLLPTIILSLIGGTSLGQFEDNPAASWRVVNDGVMGGLSQSQWTIDRGIGIFEGTVSLENNGGFASVRGVPLHTDQANGFRLKLKGDGRDYQFRVRTSRAFDGIAYRANFSTKKGEWVEVQIPLTSFEPVFRGRLVPGAPPLKAKHIKQWGFLIADQTEGPFRLEVSHILPLKN